TVETVIKPRGGTVGDVGNDVANIETFPRRLDPCHDAAEMRPGFGGIASLGVVAHQVEFGGRTPDAHLIGLDEDLSGQNRVGGKTEDVVDAILLAPIHRFASTVMTVATDGDAGVWPMQPDALHQPTQMGTHLLAVRRLPGAQDCQYAMTGAGIIDMDRQEALLI